MSVLHVTSRTARCAAGAGVVLVLVNGGWRKVAGDEVKKNQSLLHKQLFWPYIVLIFFFVEDGRNDCVLMVWCW